MLRSIFKFNCFFSRGWCCWRERIKKVAGMIPIIEKEAEGFLKMPAQLKVSILKICSIKWKCFEIAARIVNRRLLKLSKDQKKQPNWLQARKRLLSVSVRRETRAGETKKNEDLFEFKTLRTFVKLLSQLPAVCEILNIIRARLMTNSSCWDRLEHNLTHRF